MSQELFSIYETKASCLLNGMIKKISAVDLFKIFIKSKCSKASEHSQVLKPFNLCKSQHSNLICCCC